MPKLLRFFALLLSSLVFISCQSTHEVKVNKVTNSNILQNMDEEVHEDSSQNELFLKVSKNKKYFKNVKKDRYKKTKWKTLNVKTNKKNRQRFLMMTSITKKTDISFEDANSYCINEKQASLTNIFVFDLARRNRFMNKPKNIQYELLSPYDEEEDYLYIKEGDSLEAEDETMILFDWKTEKYYAVSNLLKNKDITFRCMRVD